MLKSPKNLGVIHFIGIGGIGMSGIAEILFQSGGARHQYELLSINFRDVKTFRFLDSGLFSRLWAKTAQEKRSKKIEPDPCRIPGEERPPRGRLHCPREYCTANCTASSRKWRKACVLLQCCPASSLP